MCNARDHQATAGLLKLSATRVVTRDLQRTIALVLNGDASAALHTRDELAVLIEACDAE